ncbi:MAG: hypothetical protein EBE86_024775 [Hormoscilla sp. GUM202]|nr:hypothetical protein [Hormoscilla sp. GUM202]
MRKIYQAFLSPQTAEHQLIRLLYINANFGNRYRFGTSRGKKPPDAETLSRLGLRLLRDEPSLDPRFNNLVFRREVKFPGKLSEL